MYHPQEPQNPKRLSEPFEETGEERVFTQVSGTPLDRVQDDYPNLFTPKGWRQVKEAYGETLPAGLPIENPEKYL